MSTVVTIYNNNNSIVVVVSIVDVDVVGCEVVGVI